MLKVLKSLPRRVWLIITKPERFFKKIVLDGGLEESMIKAALYGLLGGAAILVVGLIGGGTLTLAGAFVKLVVYPPVAVAVLFVAAGMMMLFAEITGGSRDWEIAVKGTSCIFFMYPVVLILDSLAWSCASLWLISLLVDGYVLFLMYNVAYHCMRGRKWKVLACIGIAAAAILAGYSSEHSIRWLAVKNPSAVVRCLASA